VLGADDKAGLAAAIEAARRLVAGGETCPTLRCVFTVKEELGLVGAKALARDAVGGDLCLVLDADGTPGGIVVAAPTHYTFSATFFGRSSHAGVAPEKGVSALKMAADAVSAIDIGRLDDATTANIGTVEGGTATNVVAGRARVTGECRSLDRARVEEVRGRMHEHLLEAARRHGGSVDIEWNLEYEGFSCAEDDAAVSLVKAACEDAGIEPRTFTTGGGSDANVIAAYGTPTLALACGMSGVHATSEQIAVADLEALTRLVVAVARRLVAEQD